MISPTGSASPPRIAHRQLAAGDELLDHHLVVVLERLGDRRLRAPPAASRCDRPTVDPCFDGFTITGKPSARSTSAVLGVALTGVAISQSAVRTPCARKRCFERSLSIASALARWPLPVYGHAGEVEQRLDRPVLAAPAVQREEHDVASPRFGSRAAVSASDSRVHARQLLRRRRQRLHHAAGEHALLVCAGHRPRRRIDRATPRARATAAPRRCAAPTPARRRARTTCRPSEP